MSAALKGSDDLRGALVSGSDGSAALAQEGGQPADKVVPPAKRASPTASPAKKTGAHAEKAATPPAAPAVQAGSQAAPQPAEAQPVTFQHAVNAKIGRCAPLIHDASAFTAGLPKSSAMSIWSKDQPDDHMFQSIMGLGYDSALGPKAAAVLVATPDSAGCEASLVQVHPTSRSCEEIESGLRKTGVAFADLSGLPVTQAETAPHQMLLPAPNGGCVVVGVAMERRAK